MAGKLKINSDNKKPIMCLAWIQLDKHTETHIVRTTPYINHYKICVTSSMRQANNEHAAIIKYEIWRYLLNV
jgi:hypothetical protein